MRRGPKPKPIHIPEDELPKLEAMAASAKLEYRLVVRARIVLMAAKGYRTVDIADRLGVSDRTVRKWKGRFRAQPSTEALKDADRSGRPARIALDLRCLVISFACDRPDDHKVPFRQVWTHQALSDAVWTETGVRISTSEIGRILRGGDLKPHHVRQWLHSQDPDFRSKARVICDLYLDPPDHSAVLCVDEKPVQVTARKHPTRVGPRAVVRREFEYVRHGTVVMFVAFNIRTGRVFVRITARRTAQATVAFLEELASRYRQREVFIIWDNLNTHYDGRDGRWTEFNRRHRGRFNFVYTPLHASWMNQAECWLSIFQRRVVRHGSFESAEHFAATSYDFVAHWDSHEAHPFRWTWRAEEGKKAKRLIAA